MIFGDVDGLPFTARDAVADLRGSFSLAGLLVGVEIFANANLTAGAVFADEAIEQAGVSLAAVAVAKTRFLVENFFDAGGDGVGVLHDGIGEGVGAHGGGESASGRLSVEGRGGVIGFGLRVG